MTIRKIASTLLLSLAMISFASAQRIAVVDVTAVLESLPEYQKAQEQLDKIATAWRQEIAQEQDKIKGMYSKYQAEQVLLSEEMKKTARRGNPRTRKKTCANCSARSLAPKALSSKNAKNW
jgi:outer membrane protein